MKRISMNFDEKLLNQLDEYASKMHITRTSAVAIICSQYFQGIEGINTLNQALKIYEEEKVTIK